MTSEIAFIPGQNLNCDYCGVVILSKEVREDRKFITLNAQEYLIHARCESEFFSELKRTLVKSIPNWSDL